VSLKLAAMKKISQLSILFVLALFTLTNCTQQVAVDVKDEIQARNDQLIEAVFSADYEAIGDIYMENAVFLPQNSDVLAGKDAAVELYKSFPAMGITDVKLEAIEAKAYGSIAVEEGRYEMYVGDQKVDYGKYIVIWEKVEGEWKISKDIINSSVPPPPPPAPESETETDS